FFQAEDGIRDLIVTGVQTCALPIYLKFEWYPLGLTGEKLIASTSVPEPSWRFVNCFGIRYRSVEFVDIDKCTEILAPILPLYFQIGRASCRERVEISVGVVAL